MSGMTAASKGLPRKERCVDYMKNPEDSGFLAYCLLCVCGLYVCVVLLVTMKNKCV